jgi:hypothetical protein
MGLKGYRLWVMGQLEFNLHRPTTLTTLPLDADSPSATRRGVPSPGEPRCSPVQLAFESKVLKPGNHI